MLIDLREGDKEGGGRNVHVRINCFLFAPRLRTTGHGTQNLGMCPDKELNLWPFGLLTMLQPTWATPMRTILTILLILQNWYSKKILFNRDIWRWPRLLQDMVQSLLLYWFVGEARWSSAGSWWSRNQWRRVKEDSPPCAQRYPSQPCIFVETTKTFSLWRMNHPKVLWVVKFFLKNPVWPTSKLKKWGRMSAACALWLGSLCRAESRHRYVTTLCVRHPLTCATWLFCFLH